MTCLATRPCLSTRHLDFFALNFMRAQETLSPSADRTHLACIWVVVVTARSSIKPLIDASGEPWYALLLYRCIYVAVFTIYSGIRFANTDVCALNWLIVTVLFSFGGTKHPSVSFQHSGFVPFLQITRKNCHNYFLSNIGQLIHNVRYSI